MTFGDMLRVVRCTATTSPTGTVFVADRTTRRTLGRIVPHGTDWRAVPETTGESTIATTKIDALLDLIATTAGEP